MKQSFSTTAATFWTCFSFMAFSFICAPVQVKDMVFFLFVCFCSYFNLFSSRLVKHPHIKHYSTILYSFHVMFSLKTNQKILKGGRLLSNFYGGLCSTNYNVLGASAHYKLRYCCDWCSHVRVEKLKCNNTGKKGIYQPTLSPIGRFIRISP